MKNKAAEHRKRTLALSVAAVVAIAGSLAYVVLSSLSAGDALEYFKDVDEALNDFAQLEQRRLRLHGNVVAGTVQKKPGSLDYRFAIFSRKAWVEVNYRGLVPDTFKDCAEVVVKGKFQSRQRFLADEVTAKCPSKYDEKQRLSGCGEPLKQAVLARRNNGSTSS